MVPVPTTRRQSDDGESDIMCLNFGAIVMNPVLVIWLCVTTENVQSDGFILTASESDVHLKGSDIALHAANFQSFVSRKRQYNIIYKDLVSYIHVVVGL